MKKKLNIFNVNRLGNLIHLEQRVGPVKDLCIYDDKLFVCVHAKYDIDYHAPDGGLVKVELSMFDKDRNFIYDDMKAPKVEVKEETREQKPEEHRQKNNGKRDKK